MQYCKNGDTPTLTYQFVGQSKKVVKTEFSPIDVTVRYGETNSTSNYSPAGFGLSAYSTSNFYDRGYILRDYYVLDLGIPVNTFDYRYNFELYGKLCYSPQYFFLNHIAPSSISINPNLKCPTPEAIKTIIEVNYNNLIIFRDQAIGNVTFSVACGDCPEGYSRCLISEYPGYCCLDCSATAASIRAITNELRTKNG